MHRIVISLLMMLTVIACSNTPSIQQPDPLSQSSAVSVAMPGFVTAAGTTLHWRSDLIWVDDPEGRYERRGDMLQDILQTEFEHKGYRFVGPGEDAQYDVVAVALFGDLQDQEEIEQVFRLYPSLAAKSDDYTRGTLLVALAPSGTNDIVWRGALEAFTDQSMQPLEVRTQRMQWAAQQLLGSIPSY